MAIGMLLVCLLTYRHTSRFVEDALPADGTIVELIEREGEDGPYFYPVFTFTDDAGATQKIYSSHGSFPPRHKVGDSVTVLYDPADPEDAKINSFMSIWFWPFLTGIIGSVILVGSSIVLIIARLIDRRFAGRRDEALATI